MIAGSLLRALLAAIISITALHVDDHPAPARAPQLVAITAPATTTTTTSTTAKGPAAEPAPSTTMTATRTPGTTTVPRSTTTTRTKPAPRPTPPRYACPVAVSAIAAAGAPTATLTTWDAIAWRESRCQLYAHRHVGGDDSWCWWQIEYGHGLGASRTHAFGPGQLAGSSSSACARAALALYRQAGWQPWR